MFIIFNANRTRKHGNLLLLVVRFYIAFLQITQHTSPYYVFPTVSSGTVFGLGQISLKICQLFGQQMAIADMTTEICHGDAFWEMSEEWVRHHAQARRAYNKVSLQTLKFHSSSIITILIHFMFYVQF